MYNVWSAEVKIRLFVSLDFDYNQNLRLLHWEIGSSCSCWSSISSSGGSDNAILFFTSYYNNIITITTISFVYKIEFEMDFFDKLKTSLSSPLRNLNLSGNSDADSISTWSLDLPGFTEKHIRLLLYRDCDRRGKKCLYDSHHVIRDKNGKFSYIPAAPSSCSEMKNLSDYIFGCVALSSSGCGTKRFHKYNGKYVWSQVFNPKTNVPPPAEVQPTSPCKLKLKLCSSVSVSPGKVPVPLTQQEQEQPEDQDQVDGCITNRKSERKANSAFSLPAVAMVPPTSTSPNSSIGKCLSLPSKLVDCSQKTLLGLAIMIESNPENKDVLGPYLLSISHLLEECSTWFSTIAAQAYRSPNTFVQTLYDFSTEFKTLLYKRLSSPLISPSQLSPSWKSIQPALATELIQLILQFDECNCKIGERIKLVIVGGSKKVNEVTGLLYLLKLLLLKCKSSDSDMDVGIDATHFYETVNNNSQSQSQEHQTKFPHPQTLPSFDSVILSSSTTSASISSLASSTSSPPHQESISMCQQVIGPRIQEPKVETEKFQRRDYDSGIELELETTSNNASKSSMKRSVSQKFDSGIGSSSDEPDTLSGPRRYSKGSLLQAHQTHSHEFEEVTFHLGDLGVDHEQSINTLALSEPNLDKLKVYRGTSGFMEPVDTNLKVERLTIEPIHVKLNLDQHPSPATSNSTGPKSAYCQFCDSVAIVDKFSPFYYIQWIRSCWGLGEEGFNAMKSFSTSKFIVVNLDKNYIRTVNFEPNENYTSTKTSSFSSSSSSSSSNNLWNIALGTVSSSSTSSNQSSCLISNLLHNLHTLSSECKESEIENFLHLQIDFIRKIAHDFGQSWSGSGNSDSNSSSSSGDGICDEELVKKKYSYLSLSYKDLNLIYSLAKMKFPSLAHISFPES